MILLIFLLYFSVVFTSPIQAEDRPSLMSESAILIDTNSGQILYDKNSKKKMYPASITKIVTGILAIEEGNLNDIVTVSKNATETHGTSVYLLENEKVKLKRLVQGLLINSGNDAGTAIAEHFSGSQTAFAEKMNDFVKTEIGITDSNFTNPHGLFNKNHYTTAYDMAKISQYAMKNSIFREIVSTEQLKWDGEGWKTTIYNHHKMLGNYKGVTGIKNGYVPESGYTLVTSATRNGMDLIAVTLGARTSQSAYNDTTALLDFGFSNYTLKTLSEDKVYNDEKKNKYKLKKQRYFTVPKDFEISRYIREGDLIIENKNGTVLFEQELKKINKTSSKKRTIKSSEPSEDGKKQSQNSQWIIQVLDFTSLLNYIVI
ncbi:D-alanyl-D-alanine carboxypeptidase family protein [Salibacterium qingdaonense]|uniref:D-alanyl-D-alanine carboxypeptidase n=1 Tax=Salibacterium qingdaonense TaxID=266892 RepID=A0A1I4IMY0_9BACI|nr:D-alanyl-D-alanine carboxypeptidase family protein [Salibacterium qingdaonense]SFL55161.1 D-alanyl-D-alanine carboxypeptidase [Salibacterium qingdaonense]